MSGSSIDIAVREHDDSIGKELVTTGEPFAVLHMSAESTAISLRQHGEPERVVVIAPGTLDLAARYFLHTPPSALDLENAIAAVEDEIARASMADGTNFPLFTADPEVRKIALLAGLRDSSAMVMHVGAVEGVFGRLASVAEGQPPSYAGIPTDSAFGATLLILREVMHHLHFSEIHCV